MENCQYDAIIDRSLNDSSRQISISIIDIDFYAENKIIWLIDLGVLMWFWFSVMW